LNEIHIYLELRRNEDEERVMPEEAGASRAGSVPSKELGTEM
jgi:hypothetical protein